MVIEPACFLCFKIALGRQFSTMSSNANDTSSLHLHLLQQHKWRSLTRQTEDKINSSVECQDHLQHVLWCWIFKFAKAKAISFFMIGTLSAIHLLCKQDWRYSFYFAYMLCDYTVLFVFIFHCWPSVNLLFSPGISETVSAYMMHYIWTVWIFPFKVAERRSIYAYTRM